MQPLSHEDEPGRSRRTARRESGIGCTVVSWSLYRVFVAGLFPGGSLFFVYIIVFRCVVFFDARFLFLLGTHRDAVGAYSIILQFDARVRVRENHVIAVALFFRFNHPGVPFAADATEHACR